MLATLSHNDAHDRRASTPEGAYAMPLNEADRQYIQSLFKIAKVERDESLEREVGRLTDVLGFDLSDRESVRGYRAYQAYQVAKWKSHEAWASYRAKMGLGIIVSGAGALIAWALGWLPIHPGKP